MKGVTPPPPTPPPLRERGELWFEHSGAQCPLAVAGVVEPYLWEAHSGALLPSPALAGEGLGVGALGGHLAHDLGDALAIGEALGGFGRQWHDGAELLAMLGNELGDDLAHLVVGQAGG